MSKVLTQDKILAGNVYYRHLQVTNFNSNVVDSFTGGPCPPDCPGANVQSTTDQATYGGTLQFSVLRPLWGFENKFTVGTSYDHGDTRFKQSSQDAVFTNDRNTIGVDPFTLDTDVKGTNTYTGLFATNTFSFNSITHLTLSGRYNHASVSVRDQTGTTPDLNGDNIFVRFNPAAGLNFNPNKALNAYLTYNEGMRTPTPMELTCANPAAPCTLPNAFLSDPPLKPVISKTWEVGTRGMLAENTAYNASLFRTDLRDDIQFITASTSNTAGFFQNVGKTRRQGLELGIQQGVGKLAVRAAYSYIDATYRTAFVENSPSNSSANSAGDIQVNSGDRIPGIPRHNLKVRADYAFTPKLSVGLNVVYASSQFARGDENNKDANGAVPGYTVFNLDGRWNVTEQLQFFAKITNLFNRNYETFGILGENFFRGPGFTYDLATAGPEQFRSPGAPRGIWIGVRYEFEKARKPATGGDN
jgi:outer membrane receptor protein involved in Fe transport